jgi:phosphoribosylanthranilate isomerase
VTAIKICGIKDHANGLVAIDAGADYLGFIFYPPSHRALPPAVAADLIRELRAARPTGWQAVGVFVNEPIEVIEATAELCGLDIVQLNGEEPTEYIGAVSRPVFKSVKMPDAPSGGPLPAIPTAVSLRAARILLDANVPGYYGGTGVTYRWSDLGDAVAEGFLAGGLTPDNVEAAVAQARPWGVDVSSGVEQNRQKDPALIQAFIAAVRRADATNASPTLASAGGQRRRSPEAARGRREGA